MGILSNMHALPSCVARMVGRILQRQHVHATRDDRHLDNLVLPHAGIAAFHFSDLKRPELAARAASLLAMRRTLKVSPILNSWRCNVAMRVDRINYLVSTICSWKKTKSRSFDFSCSGNSHIFSISTKLVACTECVDMWP